MKEDFLHYLWKFKKFGTAALASNEEGLYTTSEQLIELVHVGTHNVYAGPDFFNAKLYVDQQLWAGNVEIHIKASDWYLHGHELDNAYANVILHVVWEHDCDIYRADNSVIPTLCLKEYVSQEALNNYQNLFARQNQKWILCQNNIANIPKSLKDNWLERLFFERLSRKTDSWEALLKGHHQDWEYILFVVLARNFGTKINAAAFENIALSIQPSVFRKCVKDAFQLEALFLGLSGVIPENTSCSYALQLEGEYEFLKHKYAIENVAINAQFFKLRPPNFPTIRLSQLAQLYANKPLLFQLLMKQETARDYYEVLNVKAGPYWDTHYSFGALQKKSVKRLTKGFIDILLINCILPLRFIYEKSLGISDTSKIFEIICSLKPEKNAVISGFKALQLIAINAQETQALIELKTQYCEGHKCLQCALGSYIIEGKG